MSVGTESVVSTVPEGFCQIFDLNGLSYTLTNRLDKPEITRIQAYNKSIHSNEKIWIPTKQFASAQMNLRLGQAVEDVLPEDIKQALINLSMGKPPYIVVLKGMPKGKRGNDIPEEGNPLCAQVLRGLVALLTKQNSKSWEEGNYAPSFRFFSYDDAGMQRMHSDNVLDEDGEGYGKHKPATNQHFTLFHCVSGDPLTPTYFAAYSGERSRTEPDPRTDFSVCMESGDVVIFNNMQLLHARGERLPDDKFKAKPLRHIIALDTVTAKCKILGEELSREVQGRQL